jgi:hypothetical protein
MTVPVIAMDTMGKEQRVRLEIDIATLVWITGVVTREYPDDGCSHALKRAAQEALDRTYTLPVDTNGLSVRVVID